MILMSLFCRIEIVRGQSVSQVSQVVDSTPKPATASTPTYLGHGDGLHGVELGRAEEGDLMMLKSAIVSKLHTPHVRVWSLYRYN